MSTTAGPYRQYSKQDMQNFLYKDNLDDDDATATLDEEIDSCHNIRSDGTKDTLL